MFGKLHAFLEIEPCHFPGSNAETGIRLGTVIIQTEGFKGFPFHRQKRGQVLFLDFCCLAFDTVTQLAAMVAGIPADRAVHGDDKVICRIAILPQ